MQKSFLVRAICIACMVIVQIFSSEREISYGVHIDKHGVQTSLSADENLVIAQKALAGKKNPVAVVVRLNDDTSVVTSGLIEKISGVSNENIIKAIDALVPADKGLTQQEKTNLLNSIPKEGKSWNSFNTQLDKIFSARGKILNHQDFVQKLHEAEANNSGKSFVFQKSASTNNLIKKMPVDVKKVDKIEDMISDPTVQTLPIDQIQKAYVIQPVSRIKKEIYIGIDAIKSVSTESIDTLIKQSNKVLSSELLESNPVRYIQIVAELLDVVPDLKVMKQKLKDFLRAIGHCELKEPDEGDLELLNAVMKNLAASTKDLITKDTINYQLEPLIHFADYIQEECNTLFEEPEDQLLIDSFKS